MGMGVFEMLFILLAVGGAPGGLLPISLPPQPVDAKMLALAPEECFLGYAHMGRADIGPNPTSEFEKLLREPGVAKFQTEFFHRIEEWLVSAAARGGAVEEDQQRLKRIIRHVRHALDSPLVVYANFDLSGPFGAPMPTAGAAAQLGKEEAADALALIGDLLQQAGAPVERPQIAPGIQGLRIVMPIGVPIDLAVADDLLIVAVGSGEAKNMLDRRGGQPCPAFEKIRRDMPVQRPNTIAFVNIHHAIQMAKSVAPAEVSLMFQAIGIDNLVGIESITGLDGRYFVGKQRVRFDGKVHGIMASIGQDPIDAADFAAIPADALAAQTLQLAPLKIFDAIKSTAAAIDPGAEAEFERAMEMFRDQVGLELRDDILAALTGEVQFVMLKPSAPNQFALRVTANLRDADKARKAAATLAQLLETQLGQGPNVATMSKSEHGGQTVYVLKSNARGVPPNFASVAWAVSDKYLVIGLGEAMVTQFLDQPVASPSLATRPEIQQVLSKQPFSVLYMDTRSATESALPALGGLLAMLGAQGPRIDPSLLPPADQVVPHMLPTIYGVYRRDDGFYVESTQTMPGLNITPMTGLGVALLLPALQQARMSARRAQSQNNMRQIMLALHNYHDAHRAFPPAYTVDKEGKPLLSWRVLILPYLEQQDLYNQFHLDEPWDSNHNKKLIEKMPEVFASPQSAAKPGETTYLAFQMKDAVMAKPADADQKAAAAKGLGTRIRDITDGTSNTVVFAEFDAKSAVPWTKPADFNVDEKNPTKGLTSPYPGQHAVAFADGSVRRISSKITAETWLNLIRKSDNNVINRDELDR